jgi:hypothetical protein
MSDAWYYAEGDKSIGPIALADLIAILSRVSKAQSVLVWRDGLSNWVEAKDLPELAPHVVKPPPLPSRRPVRPPLPVKGAIPEIEGKELELTWLRMMRVWGTFLSRFWAAALGAGLIIYLTNRLGEDSEKSITRLSTDIGVFLSVSWFLFFSVRDALQKHYRDFWIAIVPSNPELTWFRMMRVSSTCLAQYWMIAGLDKTGINILFQFFGSVQPRSILDWLLDWRSDGVGGNSSRVLWNGSPWKGQSHYNGCSGHRHTLGSCVDVFHIRRND